VPCWAKATVYDTQSEHDYWAKHFREVSRGLDGAMLKHLIGNRPMELETLLSPGIEIADALDAAHSEPILPFGLVWESSAFKGQTLSHGPIFTFIQIRVRPRLNSRFT
jgi:hypothetical protein